MKTEELADLATVIAYTKTIIATANWSVVPKDKMILLRNQLKVMEEKFVNGVVAMGGTIPLENMIDKNSKLASGSEKPKSEEKVLAAKVSKNSVVMAAPEEKLEPAEEEVKQLEVKPPKKKGSFRRVDADE